MGLACESETGIDRLEEAFPDRPERIRRRELDRPLAQARLVESVAAEKRLEGSIAVVAGPLIDTELPGVGHVAFEQASGEVLARDPGRVVRDPAGARGQIRRQFDLVQSARYPVGQGLR
ncbi:MAG: hypothetical protein QXG03_11120 [Halalkalicoccus sp.]